MSFLQITSLSLNAGDCDFTAGNGELNGDYTELIKGETGNLSGLLNMPAYSIQYLKMK